MPRDATALLGWFFAGLGAHEKDGVWPRRLLGAVLFLWVLLLLVVGIRGYFQPRKNSVFPAYYQAGQQFAQQSDLYGQQDKALGIDVYRYSPAFAALMVPLSALPENAAGTLWRAGQGIFLLAVLLYFCMQVPLWRDRAGSGANQAAPQDLAIATFLCASFFLSISSLNNAQLNAAITACCLLSVLLARQGRWALAGSLLALPVFIKIFPFSLFLLLALAAPLRFGFSFLGVLVALFLAPFLAAPAGYVLSQYRDWWAFLGHDDRHYWPLEAGYRDLWMVLRLCRLDIPIWAYQTIQILLAFFAALLVVRTLRIWGRSEAVETALVTGVLWMILCGPSTESSTYTLLGPVVGLLLARALEPGRDLTFRCLSLIGSFLLLLGVLAGLFPHGGSIQALGIQPLGALFLGAAYLQCLSGRFARPATGPAWPTPMHNLGPGAINRQSTGWFAQRGWLDRHAETPA